MTSSEVETLWLLRLPEPGLLDNAPVRRIDCLTSGDASQWRNETPFGSAHENLLSSELLLEGVLASIQSPVDPWP
jgi:hypothetical protein